MNNITGVIIAKNEEEMIAQAIKSLDFCEEVIIIDNGSTDRTKQISLHLGAKVYETESNNFSEFRNLGLLKAKNEWLIYLDADERVDQTLKNSIQKALSSSDCSAYLLKRKNYYLGENLWPKIEKLERLFKKDKLKTWKGVLHESPEFEGKLGELDGFIIHYTHRNLETMLNKTSKWSTTEALLRYNSSHPKMTWWRFPRVMITAFFDSYILQKGFKAGVVGLIESIFQSYSMFITYAKLWEMQQIKEQQFKK